MGIDKHTV